MLSLALLAGMVAISQIPSLLVAPAAGILAAGILGNSLSAAWNDMEVPNPLVIGGEHAFIAFNLADVWALAGILALVCTIGIWLIRNRELLPPDGRGPRLARSRVPAALPGREALTRSLTWTKPRHKPRTDRATMTACR